MTDWHGRLLAACAAMQGLLADGGWSGMSPEKLAERSVELADALLAEVEREPDNPGPVDLWSDEMFAAAERKRFQEASD